MFWTTVGIAARAIARNTMRSILTMLGIVIGVAAVIGMVHLGESATRQVTDQIASLGHNLLMVTPGAGQRGPGGARSAANPMEAADGNAMMDEIPNILVAPTSNTGSLTVNGNINWPSQIIGTTNAFFEVRDWDLEDGRPFESYELGAGVPVCILGATVRRELFADADPVGASIRVGKLACTVIGVLTSKQAMMGSDPDDVVLMPLRAVQRRLTGNDNVGMFYVTALVDGTTQQVRADIERLMRERRRIRQGNPDDFTVRDMKEIADRVTGTAAAMATFLAAIAAVSLIVGGIGIMNIMLVSVTERTREIGIRMAVGARGREVMMQFLVESAMLSTLGGIIGIGIGVGGSYLWLQETGGPFVLVPGIITIAFVVSAAVGVVFGYLPARKASRLNPIDALRHE